MATRVASSREADCSREPPPVSTTFAMEGAALRYNAAMRFGEELRANLPAGGFGQVLYAYDSIDSTNTRAMQLAGAGAAHGTLVVADEQMLGRGRGGARWSTPRGSAVAMSLVLRPSGSSGLRWTGLGALAVAEALRQERLPAWIKWPNDVLVGGRKLAGVLVEVAWEGNQPAHVVLGIGINASAGSAPDHETLAFPATTVESEARRPVSRFLLIGSVLRFVEKWYGLIASPAFLEAWSKLLAFKDEWVQVETGRGVMEGRLLGLGPDGEARIETDMAEVVLAGADARTLRPLPFPC